MKLILLKIFHQTQTNSKKQSKVIKKTLSILTPFKLKYINDFYTLKGKV